MFEHRISLAAFVCAATLAACGGGGGGGGSGPGTPAAPTPTPGVLSVAPTSLSIVGVGAGDALTINVVEGAYSNPFTESDTCAGIATVSTTSAVGPSATYTVTGVAVGSCSATFTDTKNQSLNVPLTVTASQYVVQGVQKK